jgi:hypothetical protein
MGIPRTSILTRTNDINYAAHTGHSIFKAP